MIPIRDVMRNKYTYVIAPIFVYNNKGKPQTKGHRVLSCVIYFLKDNYVCIDYISCQSKTFIIIYSNKIFKQTSFNLSLGIGIPELLLNLLSCHGSMDKPNEIIILNFRYCLVNNYLAKGFSIIKKDSKQLSIILKQY